MGHKCQLRMGLWGGWGVQAHVQHTLPATNKQVFMFPTPVFCEWRIADMGVFVDWKVQKSPGLEVCGV